MPSLNDSAVRGRLVIVPAEALDDLIELARLAVGRLDQNDPLTKALNGAAAQVSASMILDVVEETF